MILHCDLRLAKVILWAKGHDVEAIERAERTLWRFGYLRPCTRPGHDEDCVVVVR